MYTVHNEYPANVVDDFRSLKGKQGHIDRGLFIAEGPKIVRKMLESSIEVVSAFLTPEYFEEFQTLFENRANGSDWTDIYIAPKSEMEQVVGYALHQGVMLACRIPQSRTIEEAANDWQPPFVVIALDSIADAENMGAIIRNAAAFGAKAVIVDNQSCNPYLRRSVRVSMGTIADVEIIRVSDLAHAIGFIRPIGPISVIGATISPNSRHLASLPPPERTILVFGSEGWGLRESVAAACDTLAMIPMADGVDSLNVAIASGIFLYWATNQTN
jgi:tRNA G18 (ribose-2'-O)-methylase SpoU